MWELLLVHLRTELEKLSAIGFADLQSVLELQPSVLDRQHVMTGQAYRPLAMAMALAVPLLLTACGASTEDQAGVGVPPDSAPDGMIVEEADDLEEADDEATETGSPLIEFLGYETSGAAATAEFENLVATEVGACMRAQGFEYVDPAPSAPAESEMDVMAAAASDRQWVAEWGFGVSTQAFSQDEVGPDLRGYEIMEPDRKDDPNQIYFSELSSAEQAAYQEALLGAEGCTAAAFDRAVGETQNAGFIQEFGVELEQLDRRIEADPRLVQFEQGIATCVTGAGYQYTTFAAAQERFSVQVGSLVQRGAELTDSEAEADSSLPTLTPEQLELLAGLQAEEIEIALAAFDCGWSLTEFLALRDEIQIDLEREFVEANRDRLEEFIVDG